MNDLVKRLHLLSNDLAEMEDTIGDKFTLPNEAAAELTRLRERNAELEKERDDANEALTIAYMQGGFASTDRVATLEATVRELREAALSCKESFTHFLPAIGTFRAVKQKDFEALMAALAASESVVKSEGEKDGVE